MTEDELRRGAVIQLAGLDQPIELLLPAKRTDGSWFLLLRDNYSVVASADAVRNATLLKQANPLVPVVQNGQLTVPLYHGTNSVWYESIRAHGLGGRNVIGEFRVIELLAELLAISHAAGIPRENYHVSAEVIAAQKVVPNGWNFRHGSTYLCASAMKAAGYATDKRCGSEAIEYCFILYDSIRASRPDLLESVMPKMEPLLSLAEKSGVPLVLEVRSIPVTILRDEHGGDVSGELNVLSELVTWHADDMPSFGQMVIIESIGVIPPSSITAYTFGQNYVCQSSKVDLVPWPASSS
jgi:hypothetical protein